MISKYLEIVAKGKVDCKLEDIDVENLDPDEAIIQNEASIISAGTELSRVFALKPGVIFPVRPGYGAVGRILRKGKGLIEFEAGDLVYYLGSHSSLQRFRVKSSNQWDHLFKVPAGLTPIDASLVCMIAIAMTGPNACQVKIGDHVAVFGLGVVGLLAALLYGINGAQVIGIDPIQSRCDLAKALGVGQVLSCPQDMQIPSVLELTGQVGADISVDAVGHSSVVMQAVRSTRPYGEVVLLGTPREACEGNLTEAFNAIHMKMLDVKGGLANMLPLRNTPGMKLSFERNYRVAFDLMLSKRIDASRIISHVIKPEEAEKAYHGLQYDRENYRCVVIDWR